MFRILCEPSAPVNVVYAATVRSVCVGCGHRHGAALPHRCFWRFCARKVGPAAAHSRASLAPQVHRTPSEHPIHPYEAGEGLLRPLPPVTSPIATAVGDLVDTEAPLGVADALLREPAIEPEPEPTLSPDRQHAGPFF